MRKHCRGLRFNRTSKAQVTEEKTDQQHCNHRRRRVQVADLASFRRERLEPSSNGQTFQAFSEKAEEARG